MQKTEVGRGDKRRNSTTSSSEKMESLFSWFHLVIFFRTIWASSSPYTVHWNQNKSFDEASRICSPGALTTLATQQEVLDILSAVSGSATGIQKEFNFWVGLKKVKEQCVDYTLPLRGFKWTEGGSQESPVIHWAKEPEQTCTTVRCASLKGKWDGSNFPSWGLNSDTCKNNHDFICKLRDGGTTTKPEPTLLAPPEPPKSAVPRPPIPAASEPTAPQKPAAPEPPKHAIPTKSEPRPSTKQPETSKPEPGLPSLGQKPDLKLDNRPEIRSGSCQNPFIPSARSISLDNSSRIRVECWSSDLVELRCSDQPPVWVLLDGSPANFSTVCVPCAAGFRKDASGFCVDVDECAGAACKHGCQNTAGSFRCFCSNQDGERLDEDSPACAGATAGVLVPVLVAAATLVVAVV